MDLPWSGVIGGIIATVMISFVLWSANRRKPGELPRTAAFYGTPMIVVATITVLAYLASMIVFMLGVLSGNPAASSWVFMGLGFFGLLLAAVVFDVFTRRIDWSDAGLRFQSWRGEGVCDWADIASADYKPLMQYWKVTFQDRSGFALFEYMTGARDFLEAARGKGVLVTVSGAQAEPPAG